MDIFSVITFVFDPTINNGNANLPVSWFTVDGDIFNCDNWGYRGYY